MLALLMTMVLNGADAPTAPTPFVRPSATPAAVAPAPTASPAPVVTPRPTPVRTVTPPRPAVRPVPRIDAKKPYMRVWYWPPMPVRPTGPDIFGQAPSATRTGEEEVDPRGNKLDDVNFPTNRVKVVDEQSQLEHLAGWMRANPKIEVILDGYADPRGSQAHNQKLAAKRAQSVRDFLVSRGVPATHITAVGHGASSPVRGETRDEGYWLSRRVVIRFKNAPEALPARPAASPKPQPEKEH